ncbi:MAG: hypothetical protein ABS81_06015 [Pseudonocardia sp. SCN 72-86]|nr:MAG: hypothetical protein ABS81_06015 [Pseudonocardia sp. SCN 72-86]
MPNGDVGMRSLERGLAVIRAFPGHEAELTIADLSRLTGYDRAVVRRILGTLERLEYVRYDDGRFSLRARILELGSAYLATNPLSRIGTERLVPFAEQTSESCLLGVLDTDRVVYIARAQAERIAGPVLRVGVTVEPHLISIGRVLLAALDDAERDTYFAAAELVSRTPFTITSEAVLRDELVNVSDQGWCMVDQEIELGVVALAVPVRNAQGRVIAGMNITTHTSRCSPDELRSSYLGPLIEVRDKIEADYALVRD